MKNKGIKTLVVVFLILFVLDLLSTLRVGDVGRALEANPIYPYVGFIGIGILNVGLILLVYGFYSLSKKDLNRFMIMSPVVILCLIRIVTIYGNWKVGNNPPTLEQAEALTQDVKLAHYYNAIVLPMILWLGSSIITYLFFRPDHVIEVKA